MIKCIVELIKMSSPRVCVAIEDRLNIQLESPVSSICSELAARSCPLSEVGKQSGAGESWNR